MSGINFKRFARGVLICMSAAAILAGCGGANDGAGSAMRDSKLLASGGACYAAWNGAIAYSGGAKVSYNNTNYIAAYWTQGNNPASNSGSAGSGMPWSAEGSCGDQTTSTSSTVSSTTSTTAATSTTTLSSSTTSSVATTVTSTTTSIVSNGCINQVWSASTVFNTGQRASYQNVEYEAKWWTQGDNPAQSGSWGVWKTLGVCVTQTSTTSTISSTTTTTMAGVSVNLAGIVSDAASGNVIAGATVKIMSGSCNGAGCTGSPVREASDSIGAYTFDAYGDFNGVTNVKRIAVAAREEALTLLVERPGYQAVTIYHQPKYANVVTNGKTYRTSKILQIYLCSTGSVDTDGDSLCDAAEARYRTNANSRDTDGDSLSDAAELYGSNGVDLSWFGASPRKKDIFIQGDYYPILKPQSEAIDMVVQAFAAAPVGNPDGSTGIAMHFDLKNEISAADAKRDLSPVWGDFDVIKSKYFAARRAKLFHYMLFAHQYEGGSSSGLSRGIPANDSLVTLGTWSETGGTVQQTAGTIMHEFGHNAGLGHGGNEHSNYKPNYLSIMSYNYQVVGLIYDNVQGKIDYSRLRIDSLNEANLNEVNAYMPIGATTKAELSRYGVLICDNRVSGNAGGMLDLNNNGIIESTISASLNCDSIGGEVITPSQNDWDYLSYSGDGIGDDLLGVRAKGLSSAKMVAATSVERCLSAPKKK